jgi:hypothetical protein
MKGGAGYGFGDPITVGTLSVVPNSTSTPMKPDGTVDAKVAAMDGNTNSLIGGRRSRASRKGGKKSRASRKGKSKKTTRKSRKSRKMKGGAWSPGNVNAAGVGYGFTGADSGVRGGIAPASAYPARVGGAPMGADGVRSA